MPLRGSKPLTLRMRGATDAIDGTNAPAGSMFKLSNVVPSTRTADTWEPRPARVYAVAMGLRPDLFPAPLGAISCHLVVGNLCFGLVATGLNAGFDQPFVCNLVTGIFLPIAGITSANVPKTQSSIGNWVPPEIAQVGQRIIVCHPGFPGGLLKFGWFDISSFQSSALTGTLTAGSPVIADVANVIGLQPGMTIGGIGIPAGATIIDFNSPVIQVEGNGSNSGDTVLTLNYTQPSPPLASAPFMLPFAGQAVNGPGMVAGAVVVGTPTVVNSQAASATVQVTISIPSTGNQAAPATYIFSGSYEITMSAPASASGAGIALSIAGGTNAFPLWGAGDSAINHLPSQPSDVAQYNGEAWFACGTNGAPFSDPLAACVRTNATQALTTGDGLATTTVEGLPLTSALTGGIIQALIIFEGSSKVQEVTGDFSLGNLSLNALNIPTGTIAPRTVAPTMLGLAFVSPEGLRIIDFSSRISDPIGAGGRGITLPFLFTQVPTRMSANGNSDVIRIAVENDLPPGQFSASSGRLLQEWWYHISRKEWSGPHTLQTTGIQPWTSPETGVNTFIVACADIPGMLCRSDTYVSGDTSYQENMTIQPDGFLGGGNLVPVQIQTTLQPDNGGMAMNLLVEAALAMKFPSDQNLTVTALNSAGEVLDMVEIDGEYTLPIGGAATAGTFLGYSVEGFLNQYRLEWSQSIVFKQLSLLIETQARFGTTFGNLYLRYQVLPGFFLADKPLQPMTVSIGGLLNDGTGLPAAQALVIPGNSPAGTKIGTIVVMAAGEIVFNPTITLTFNQNGNFQIGGYLSELITGNTNGTQVISDLSGDVIAAGWDIGMSIWDSALEIEPMPFGAAGTSILSIAGGGLSATLSSAAVGTTVGDTFNVQGQLLLTAWATAIPAGTYAGQLQIQALGLRTSYFDFLVTVT